MSAEGIYISSFLDEQQLLTIYINQYNQINTHIDTLLNMLDEIKTNIINIIRPRRTLINRHTHTNRHNNNHRYHNNNRYQYNREQNNNNRNNNNNNRHYYNNNRHRQNNNNNRNHNNNNRHRQNNSIFYDYNNPINPTIYNENMTNLFQNFLNTSQLVCPTNEQIQNASRIIRYGNIENPLSQSCPISLDEFQENNMVRQLLHCGHLFHQSQFDEWFQNNVRCPVCRYDIRNYTSVSSQNTSSTNVDEDISNNTETNSYTTSTLNQIEHVTFDISNEQFTDIFFNSLFRSIFQSNLNSNTHNNTNNNNNNRNPLRDRIIDPSNNIL